MLEHRVQTLENSASALHELISALNEVVQAQALMLKQLGSVVEVLRTSGMETIRGLQGTTTLAHGMAPLVGIVVSMLIENDVLSKPAVITYLKKAFVYKAGPENCESDYGEFFRQMLQEIESET